MTSNELLDIALSRASYTIQSSIFKARGVVYLQQELDFLGSLTSWQWRYKTATLSAIASDNTYSLASNVAYPFRFKSTTNNRPLNRRDPAWLDQVDPDETRVGEVTDVIILGLDTSGLFEVRLYPTPSAAETISYSYWASIPKIAENPSGSQIALTVDLDLYIPRHLQPALYHGVAGLMLNKHPEAAIIEFGKKQEIIQAALIRNGEAAGDETTSVGAYPSMLSASDGSIGFIMPDTITVT